MKDRALRYGAPVGGDSSLTELLHPSAAPRGAPRVQDSQSLFISVSLHPQRCTASHSILPVPFVDINVDFSSDRTTRVKMHLNV